MKALILAKLIASLAKNLLKCTTLGKLPIFTSHLRPRWLVNRLAQPCHIFLFLLPQLYCPDTDATYNTLVNTLSLFVIILLLFGYSARYFLITNACFDTLSGTPFAILPLSAYSFVYPRSSPIVRLLSKMFIGGLNWDTTDGISSSHILFYVALIFIRACYFNSCRAEGLRNYFSEFGKVDACTIMRDPSGTSRGFAFLTFEDPASVNAVVVREHFLDGKAIDPKRAIPREEHLRNTRYFVGGLAPTTTSDSMREFFAAYGKVVDATVMLDRESGRSKGFGFVTFEDANNADQLVGKIGLVLDDKQVYHLFFHI
ncbi:hypothetical protein BD779DRAFT_237573 [Infundibulicybe gibba]|nr:hypothetical protein BD779DRAFT_237573 [Infundibulicybe gibba]